MDHAADRNLILDFSGVQYISSAGLSSVLGAGKEIDRHGGRLLICGLAARVNQIFAFSGLDTLFPLFETREAALSNCSKTVLLQIAADERTSVGSRREGCL